MKPEADGAAADLTGGAGSSNMQNEVLLGAEQDTLRCERSGAAMLVPVDSLALLTALARGERGEPLLLSNTEKLVARRAGAGLEGSALDGTGLLASQKMEKPPAAGALH